MKAAKTARTTKAKPKAKAKPKSKARVKKSPEYKRIDDTFSRICQTFKAPEKLTVSEWAEKYRYLSGENSALPGRWKTRRTPYLKDIMDAFTDDAVRKITAVAGSQIGKTEAELNMIAYMIDQDPGGAMFIMPTDQVAKDYSKRRLAPMIRDTPRLRNKVSDSRSRDSNNTISQKAYPGGMLSIFGSNSPANLASTPARYVFGDEVDRWAYSAGKEGSPIKLIEKRTQTFFNSKIVLVSTPTVRGSSRIDEEYNKGTRERWCTRCPACGEYVFIEFNNINFKYHKVLENGKTRNIIDRTEFACPECGVLSPESEVRKQPSKWIAQAPDVKGHRSFWTNSFSSPWISWADIVEEFLDSKDDPNSLKTVYNTLFGQLWEERSEVGDEEEVMERAEDYEAELPDEVLCLTCGVDTQDNRLEYEVVGYGFNNESWGIERGILMGKPSEAETWEKLDGIINKIFYYKNGRGLKISLTFVDSGGHYTDEVYENCAMRINRKVFAVKGANTANAPYVKPPTKVDYQVGQRKGKAWLYVLGVDSGKQRIMDSLKIVEGTAYRMHFPRNPEKGYDLAYFRGLLSEHLVFTPSGKPVWKKLHGHERNEALDCRNYANAAFKLLHPNLNAIKEKLARPEQEEHKKPAKPKKKQQKSKRREYEDDW